MHAQSPPAAFGQHAEIAASLRCLDHAEARLLARHRQIPVVIGGDLQEHPAVGTAFVGLPGRMLEARPEFGAGRDMSPVAHRQSHVLQTSDMGGVTLDIGEQRDIVVSAGAGEMRLQPGAEIAIGARLAQDCRVFLVGIDIDGIGRDRRLLLGQRSA